MALGKKGWLEQLIREGVAAYRADADSKSLREALGAARPGVDAPAATCAASCVSPACSSARPTR